MESIVSEIAALAARLVVEEGLDYGGAKRRAQKLLGLPARTALPDNDLVESEVRAYLSLFHADTQPAELAALRRLALRWMQRLAEFRPHVTGAVWNGTATRRSDVYLQLFCDDPKSAEIALIDHQVSYQAGSVGGFHGAPVDALSFSSSCPELGEAIGVHLMIHDHDDLRGALRPGRQGQPLRGDHQALEQRMQTEPLS
jgi:hypothetical protein